MFKGIVKWFNSQKGYGFITSEGKDIFVHYTGIEAEGYKSLTEGQNVVFDMVDSEKGVQAINVVVTEINNNSMTIYIKSVILSVYF